tara:strand:+ start:16 stop:621 length:606 start_codon:yes stop_codon:yes gene_type:complete
MNQILRISGYIFHPLLMPLLGVLCYYANTPRFVEPQFMWARVYAIATLTTFTPIITFFLLKNIGVVSSIHLFEVRERKYPLMIQVLLVLLIIKLIFKPYEDIELYYFFVGILAASLTALFLVLFKFKVSLHQMAVAGVTMFLIGVSIHFNINMLGSISVLCIINGLVASSRLHTKSHNMTELCFGFLIGALPQFLLFGFWV